MAAMREEEQNQYREKLVELHSRLKAEARGSMDNMTRTVKSPDDISRLPSHAADRDTEGLDREVALETTREQMLEKIEHALTRLDEGRYGQCEDCGGGIPPARLDALPYATRCVECEERRANEPT
jgi:DnaK suppressor protein